MRATSALARVTISELLKTRGYRIGDFGKWHIGPEDSHGTYGIDTMKTLGKSRDKSLGRDDDLYSAAIDFVRANSEEPFCINVMGHGTPFPVNAAAAQVAEVHHTKVDSTSVCSFTDWMPSLCAIPGVEKLPKFLDRADITDIWFGDERKLGKPLFWKTSAKGSSPAMREGDWKLQLPRKRRGKVELYDLSVDPNESRNVAEEHPKIAMRLSTKLRAWAAELPDDYEKLAGGQQK